MTEKVNKPLKLEGAFNVRELGGYATLDGKITRKGLFFRGDGTHALTASDIKQLSEAGVTLIVDMRSPDEVKQYPSCFHPIKGIRYENIAMYDGLQMFLNQGENPQSMAAIYIRLLDDCQSQYKKIFGLFLENKGAALFHCTAGKDRTGVVAMLLLKLAGVPDSMIIADYSVSEGNMIGLFEKQHKKLEEIGVKIPEFVFGSRAEDMVETLRYLNDKYGEAEDYLLHCGLTGQDILALKSRFVG